MDHGLRSTYTSKKTIVCSHLYEYENKTLLFLITSEDQLIIYRKYFNVEDGGLLFRRIPTPLNVIKNFRWNGDKTFTDLGQGIIRLSNFLLYKGELLENNGGRSLFKMENVLWALFPENKMRIIHMGSEVVEGFCIRAIESGLK